MTGLRQMAIAEMIEKPKPPTNRASPSALAIMIPQRLRAARKSRGLRLIQVAERIGTTAQTVQRLETGGMPITLNWLDLMCKAIGVDPQTLFAPDDDPVISMEERRRELLARARVLHAHATNFMVYLGDMMEGE